MHNVHPSKQKYEKNIECHIIGKRACLTTDIHDSGDIKELYISRAWRLCTDNMPK
jgi:hypothetical protein